MRLITINHLTALVLIYIYIYIYIYDSKAEFLGDNHPVVLNNIYYYQS